MINPLPRTGPLVGGAAPQASYRVITKYDVVGPRQIGMEIVRVPAGVRPGIGRSREGVSLGRWNGVALSLDDGTRESGHTPGLSQEMLD